VTQSTVVAQVARQAVPAVLQTRLAGQEFVAGLQAPTESQVPAVSWLPVQLGVPQGFPLGKTQAPLVASQLVGLQAMSVARGHCAVQQFPVPAMPQKPEVQSSFAVQGPVAFGATH
jgi:hypothetical protein